MNEYHKIQSLFHRDPDNNHKTFLMGQYSMPEFEYLAETDWEFTEKVDGTNVRVMYDGEKVVLGGKTDNAQLHAGLVEILHDRFTPETMATVFDEGGVVLHGEGYGAKIQKGGDSYLPDRQGFILFDVRVGGLWLQRKDVYDIADKLGIPDVPVVGFGKPSEAIAMCQSGFTSVLRESPPEGIVLRPTAELQTRRGDRIITKLKLKDFSL